MKQLTKLLSSFILLLFIGACANVVTPTGGDKDVTPPTLVRSKPANKTLNFKEKKITLEFDEYIQLKDLSRELIVSPPLKYEPEVAVKNKSLSIELKDTLQANTTYNFYFGKAISDITEGNVVEDFQYVFSTGNSIDSAGLSGSVKNAFDIKITKKVAVMLYAGQNDSLPLKEKPLYYTRTKDDGSFRFNNLKQGSYKIFALAESNNNFLYDLPDEKIAFSDSLIQIDTTSKATLFLFEEKRAKNFLKSSKATDVGKFQFVFARAVENLSINPLNFETKKEWYLPEYSTYRDTVIYWVSQDILDTFKLEISEGQNILDTVELVPVKRTTESKPRGKGNAFKLNMYANVLANNLFDQNKNIVITFSHPLKSWNFPQVTLMEGTKKVVPEIKEQGDTHRKLELVYPWKQDSTYRLAIPDSIFLDVFGLTNDSLDVKFGIKQESEYGTLKVKIVLPQAKYQYVVQLMNEKEIVLKEKTINKSDQVSFNFLQPGKYKLKMIADENNNGKWDTGSYLKKIQPEKVLLYKEDVNVRANWDIELEWK